MKFGTEVVLKGEGSSGGFDPVPPSPRYGVRKGGAGCHWSLNRAFWRKLIKQKLQGAPNLVGASHQLGPQIRILKDLGPLSFWSHGHSL